MGKLITAEEFAQMPEPPDGARQELDRGVIVTMPPPKGPHGACCSRVDRRLGNFVEANALGTVFANDTGFLTERNPDTVKGADVAFWTKERLPEVPTDYIAVPPDLAVEVVSPNDHFSRVQAKVRHYLDVGVKMVWVIDPTDRSATVYRSRERIKVLVETDTISGEEVVPGFTCLVADLLPR
jgi:Uma2 family endonuclease